MFKFLHAADIHLDSPLNKLDSYEGAPVDAIRGATRRAMDNLVQTAIAEKVAFVLIAGDLNDGDWKDYNTGLHLVSQTARLREAGIPVYIVAGNHDAASKITRRLKLPDNVHLFPAEKPGTFTIDDPGVVIHGQSFAKPAVKKDLSIHYPASVPGYFNIGLLHTCASGREGHEPYAPCTLEGLESRGYHYWALGHVHKYETLMDDPPVIFSGCIQGRHIREAGPKGCVLVTVDDHHKPEPEFIPLDVIRWTVARVDATGAESAYDVVDLFGRQLDVLTDENAGLPLVVRVVIEGETAGHSELLIDVERWCNEIRSAAIDLGGGQVWVEKIKIHTALPASEQDFQKSEGAIGELISIFEEMDSSTERVQALSEEFNDIVKKMPKELKGDSGSHGFDDVDWLSNLLKQVRPMLLKRLARKGVFE